jgi:hypothetical protein
MVELPILHYGYRTIQLLDMSGTVVGNVLVDEASFKVLGQYIWRKLYYIKTRSYCAMRGERRGGKYIPIYMSREILGLPRNPGRGGDVADHKNHDRRDNTPGNLRVATNIQSNENRRGCGSSHRFKGYSENKDKYQPRIGGSGSRIYFDSVSTEIDAALMYNYAAGLVQGEYAKLNAIPEDEMPSRKIRWKLMGIVVEKLMLEGVI